MVRRPVQNLSSYSGRANNTYLSPHLKKKKKSCKLALLSNALSFQIAIQIFKGILPNIQAHAYLL